MWATKGIALKQETFAPLIRDPASIRPTDEAAVIGINLIIVDEGCGLTVPKVEGLPIMAKSRLLPFSVKELDHGRCDPLVVASVVELIAEISILIPVAAIKCKGTIRDACDGGHGFIER
nr:hypothetical protein [Methylobacterium sp. Leaf94]